MRYDVPARIMNQATRTLIDRIDEPSDGDSFNTWVALGDATDLLRADLGQDDIVLYCSIGDIFIHGVLVPSAAIMLPDAADLMKWEENPHSSWGTAYSLNPPKAWIEPPLASSPSKTIARGEQLVFARRFEGVTDETSIELLQKLAHLWRCCTARSKSLASLCRLQSHPAQYVSGIPSAAILLSISHPIRCSTRCLANVRARISGPMIAL